MATSFGTLNFSTSFKPTSAFPLNANEYFESLTDAQAAAALAEEAGSSNTIYFYGQLLTVYNGSNVSVHQIQPDNSLLEVATASNVDDIEDAISQLNSQLSAEISRAEAAEANLQSNIDAETSARTSADTTLQAAITAEETARTAADTTLQANIDSEASTRASADTALQEAITAEETRATAAETTLQTNITTEASTRASADTTLQTNIDNEASARTTADSNLQSQIDDIEDGTTVVGKATADASGNTLTSYYGHSLSFTVDTSTFVLTAVLSASDGTVLSTQTVDLPLESVVVSGEYDESAKEVVLTLQDSSTIRFSVADLIDGLVNEADLGTLAYKSIVDLTSDVTGILPADNMATATASSRGAANFPTTGGLSVSSGAVSVNVGDGLAINSSGQLETDITLTIATI